MLGARGSAAAVPKKDERYKAEDNAGVGDRAAEVLVPSLSHIYPEKGQCQTHEGYADRGEEGQGSFFLGLRVHVWFP